MMNNWIYIIALGCIIVGMNLRLKSIHSESIHSESIHSESVKYFSVGLYYLGLLISTISLCNITKGNKILKHSIISSTMITIIWVIFELKNEQFIYQPKLPLISCSILLSVLISLVSLKYKITHVILIIGASILIIFSEYFIIPCHFQFQYMPFQCNNGLGLPLYILGWFLLYHTFLVASTSKKKINIPLISLK